MRITTNSVKKVAPPESGYQLYWDSELKGFGVRVTAGGAKSYVVQSKVNGKARRVTLGRHGTITADQARKLARIELGNMARGVDPSLEKAQRRAQAVTLAEAVESYLANRRTRSGLPLKERTKADIRYHLKTSFAPWAGKSVGGITREAVQRRYLELCKRSTAQANQAMRVLSGLMNFAGATYRTPDGERIIKGNPVSVLREANLLRAVKPRNRQVPLDRLGEWWAKLKEMRAAAAIGSSGRSAADLAALLALTGLRLGEARSIRWSDLDADCRSLRLKDTKNRRDVVLPVSKIAQRILLERPREHEFVFPARSKGGAFPFLKDCRGHLQKLAESTGIEVTAHDLRRTFRAVAAACNIELWRCKALMNHRQSHDVTLAHYADLSDVRNLMAEIDRIGEFFESSYKDSLQ